MPTTTTHKTTSQASPADASRLALEEARATLASRRAALAAAEKHAEALHERLSAGDDTVTAAGLPVADAEVKRCRLLADAASKAEARAQRGLVNTDTTLAEAVAEVVSEAVGVPAVVTYQRPSEAPANLLALFIVQTTPSTEDTINGRISGTVEALYYRSGLHRSMDGKRVKAAANRVGIRLSARDGGSQERSGATVDALRLDVRAAYAPVPVIREEMTGAEWPLKAFTQGLGQEITQRFASATDQAVGIVVRPDGLVHSGDASARERVARGGATVAQEVSSTVDEDGIRRRTVAVVTRVVMTSPRSRWTADQLGAGMVEVLKAQEGQFVGAVGRVEAVSVARVQPIEGRPGRECTARFTFVSRAPSA
jgi:hypothetical protein